MDRVHGYLTVYFEQPFWVGVFEHIENGRLFVAKVTFGVEPKDYEVNEFVQKHYYDLKFSPAVETVVNESCKNPKRIQREAKKQLQKKGIGTKSQQALKLQHDQLRTERKAKSREKKEAKAKQMFKIKQQKRKDKHRGH